MELFANLTSRKTTPGEFAAFAEASGFDGVTCSDHYWLTDACPHVWVSLAEMAIATSRVTVAPSFVNNLFRSPFEFVQASVDLQRLSRGRYEAGLGAGWSESEIVGTGQTYPDGPARARMYREAILITRELLTTGACSFEGEHYRMNVPTLASLPETPIPLVASVGGPWTLRHITPLVDRVELKVISRATRDGRLDFDALATITEDELVGMISQVRAVRDDVPIGLFMLMAAGTGARIDALSDKLGDNLCGRFVGEPAKVLDNIRALEDVGISRIQMTELVPDTLAHLAEVSS